VVSSLDEEEARIPFTSIALITQESPMSVLPHFTTLLTHSPTPSPDQAAALVNLLASKARVRIVTGAAGSGKTQLMKWLHVELIHRGRTIRGIAPTGKAALVASERTGIAFTTCHRALYRKVFSGDRGPRFADPSFICEDGEDVFLDEGSMIDKDMAHKLVQWLPNGSVIYVFADPNQLGPVQANADKVAQGRDKFDDSPPVFGFDLYNPTAHLTQIHRQTHGSPIIDLASYYLKPPGPDNKFNGWVPPHTQATKVASITPVAEWYKTNCENDAVLLARWNRAREAVNLTIREALGYRDEMPQVGERIVCLQNNLHAMLMNGEVGTITEVMPLEKNGRLHLLPVRLSNTTEICYLAINLRGDAKGFFSAAKNNKTHPTLIHWDFGYCLTIHKAQGSQYQHVGLIADGGFKNMRDKMPNDTRRGIYTSITRAITSFTVFDTFVPFGRDLILPGSN
jgi:exodeoxyribonuclease-5